MPSRSSPLRSILTGAAAVVISAIVLAPGLAGAQTGASPALVKDYGKAVAVEGAAEKPDPTLDYKVVVNVTKAGAAGAPPEELDKAARLANLLAVSGVSAAHRHIVVILSGPATAAVLNEAGLKARGKSDNPSAPLIAELSKAGVQVHVCGQALAGAKIGRAEVLPQVQVDLSALTTLTTLQLRGYVLLPD